MGTKRKRSGSLGLTEPFHRNLPEYSNVCAFFTPKNPVLKNHPLLSQGRSPRKQSFAGAATKGRP
ncbi:MAG: hypothetical protein EOS22_13560 [Mesorhizobium sp.]|nr:MAG: hypothetical protein EOS22_13560 [Mesorhizobium sp.]